MLSALHCLETPKVHIGRYIKSQYQTLAHRGGGSGKFAYINTLWNMTIILTVIAHSAYYTCIDATHVNFVAACLVDNTGLLLPWRTPVLLWIIYAMK